MTNRVTDPYSAGLTTGSTHSVAVDLADPAFRPAPWRTRAAPALQRPVDQTIYELHVRDYSVDDTTVPAAHRGTYLAFADEGLGRKHLASSRRPGSRRCTCCRRSTSRRSRRTAPSRRPRRATCRRCPPTPTSSRPASRAVAGQDGYNWGYDPYHWSAPEGSYATDPDGGARVAEFRTMVGALHSDGLHVVLDQVFNHTARRGRATRPSSTRSCPATTTG